MRSKELLTLYYYYVIFAEVFIFTCCIHSSHSIALLSFYLLIFEFFNLSFKTNQSITVLQQQNRLLIIFIIFERISFVHTVSPTTKIVFRWKLPLENKYHQLRIRCQTTSGIFGICGNSYQKFWSSGGEPRNSGKSLFGGFFKKDKKLQEHFEVLNTKSDIIGNFSKIRLWKWV